MKRKSMQERILTADKIVTVSTTTTVENRAVNYDDIECSVEIDDFMSEAPWEHCDGWEHEADWLRYPTDEQRNMQGFGYSDSNRKYFLLSIDDDTVSKRWGCNGYPGASKQVVKEAIAAVKKQAMAQLVKWYSDGWEWYTACAEFNDKEYVNYLGGIDDDDYARECAEGDCRSEVVHEMERDGYIVTNQPPRKEYSAVDSMRDRIRRNLAC